MDIRAAAERVAGLKTREYVTEVENLAKNLGAALDGIRDPQVLDIAKTSVKPRLESLHGELARMVDEVDRIARGGR